MIRFASLLWLALVAVTGFATFKVKYTVQDIEDELNKVRRQTVAEQQEIHVLRAEWTALNQPERLADLNRRFLSLASVAPKQLQGKIEDIPLRLVPEPAAPVIAAAPAPERPTAMSSIPAEAQPEPAPAIPVAAARAAPADVVVDAPAAVAASTPHPALPKIQLIATAEAAPLPATPATVKPTSAKSEGRPQPGKAKSGQQPRSLDRLIDSIAEGR
jgi:cell division protein FtsL